MTKYLPLSMTIEEVKALASALDRVLMKVTEYSKQENIPHKTVYRQLESGKLDGVTIDGVKFVIVAKKVK